MTATEVRTYADEQSLADAIAARLITRVVSRQADDEIVHICLTGGGIGTACLAAIAANPARDSIDWERIHAWWGDERYVVTGADDRNETGARAALLDLVPIPQANVHPIPGPDQSRDAEQAAVAYAQELQSYARPEDHANVPSFDICLLGIGPDAHVASLFPELPGVHDERAVLAVHGSPKPPPTRISLSFTSINASSEVWVLASGVEKAVAVRNSLSDASGPFQVPASGVHGRQRTLFLVDQAAASLVPQDLYPPA